MQTCLRLEPKVPGVEDYLYFERAKGFLSKIGKRTGKNVVRLGNDSERLSYSIKCDLHNSMAVD